MLFFAPNKRLVDLERVKWQLGEIGKAGVTSTKIVNCKAKAERLKVIENFSGTLKVIGYDGFGQFQFQVFRIQAGLLENTSNTVHDPVVAELNR